MIREKKRSAALFAYHSFIKLSSIFLREKKYGIRYFCKYSFNSGIFCGKRSFFRICLWYFSWLFVFVSRVSLADYESEALNLLSEIEGDTSNLRNVVNQIYSEHGNNLINIRDIIRKSLGYIDSYGNSGGSVADDMYKIVTRLDEENISSTQIVTKLDRLIELLENNSSGEGSGGSGGDSSITQDWVKEDTYTQFAERLWKGLGFADEGGSSLGSPSSLVEMFSTTRYSFPIGPRIFYYRDTEAEGATKTPFPGSTALWINEYPYYEEDQGATRYTYTFPELISYPVVAQLAQNSTNEIRIFKKQAWNDWQAHTNLVATLERLLTVTPPENRVDSIASLGKIEKTESGKEELIINYDTGTGDSPEAIDLNPAVTNTTEELALSVDSTTNTVSRVLSYDTISNRYTDFSRVDNTGYRDYMAFEDIPSSELNLGGGMVLNLGDNFKTVFESVLPMSTMAKLRNIFGYLWLFFYVYANWLLFKITGKAA